MQKHIFIFIGPPGSGKGSLSQLCVKKHGWAQLSTGDLCRQHIADKTEIGQQIDFFIQSGKLIPDSLVIEMVEVWLLEKFEHLNVLILDGFPRTVAQAEALNDLLKKEVFADVQLHVITLSLDDERVARRLTSRMVCPTKGCGAVYSKEDKKLAPQVDMMCDYCEDVQLITRSDDTPEAVEHRLVTYHKHANELIEYYRKKNQQIKVLVPDKPLDQVYDNFMKLVGFKSGQ